MFLSSDLTKELKRPQILFYGWEVQKCVTTHEFLDLFHLFNDAGGIILNKPLGVSAGALLTGHVMLFDQPLVTEPRGWRISRRGSTAH